MTKQEIEEYFQKELYEEAAKKLRNALQEDSSNAEWFYYLYLAENKDYANVDFDNVHNEMDLNRAMELSNKRLRMFFESEYSFYRALDPNLRKFFTYASRGNFTKFSECLDAYDFKPTKLICNSSNENDFYSNLDYLVTIRIKPEIVYLNILALNILYIVTKEKGVLDILNTLNEKAIEANMIESSLDVFQSKIDLQVFYFLTQYYDDLKQVSDFVDKISNQKLSKIIDERESELKTQKEKNEVYDFLHFILQDDEWDRIKESIPFEVRREGFLNNLEWFIHYIPQYEVDEDEEIDEDEEMDEESNDAFEPLDGDDLENDEKEDYIQGYSNNSNQELDSKSYSSLMQDSGTRFEPVKEAPKYMKVLGINIKKFSIWLFILMLVFFFVFVVVRASNYYNSFPFFVICEIIFLLSFFPFISAIVGRKREDRMTNGSGPALVCCIFIFFIFTVALVMNNTI